MLEQRIEGKRGQPQYEDDSWLDPRVAVRPSPIAGFGLFAEAPISAGEAVIRWGGRTFTDEELKVTSLRTNSVAQIGERVYMAEPADGEASPDEYMNHSCEPNLWMQDEVTLVAMRDIEMGEELTADYATWVTDHLPDHADYTQFTCQCGSPLCRGSISGNDWQLPELQERYGGHFSPFLNRRITQMIEKAG